MAHLHRRALVRVSFWFRQFVQIRLARPSTLWLATGFAVPEQYIIIGNSGFSNMTKTFSTKTDVFFVSSSVYKTSVYKKKQLN